jgi:hypothetical protein
VVADRLHELAYRLVGDCSAVDKARFDGSPEVKTNQYPGLPIFGRSIGEPRERPKGRCGVRSVHRV